MFHNVLHIHRHNPTHSPDSQWELPNLPRLCSGAVGSAAMWPGFGRRLVPPRLGRLVLLVAEATAATDHGWGAAKAIDPMGDWKFWCWLSYD